MVANIFREKHLLKAPLAVLFPKVLVLSPFKDIFNKKNTEEPHLPASIHIYNANKSFYVCDSIKMIFR